jgi:WD40 repeat protein
MSGNSDERSPGTDRGRLDTTGEFFSVGTPLHAVRAGYVRRGADDVLYETAVSGRYAHVIAPDRSGKSSLVAAATARLENNGFKVAILDLEQIGVRDAGTDAGRWYYSVAYRLLRQLRIKVDLQTWWQDKSILSNRQRLVEFYSEIILRNVHERIVVFVDEIQCIEELPFADQLLASIRAAHSARATDPEFSRLTFVLLGECDPLSLIDEPELSPFNITQPITLGDFTRAELDLFSTELNLPPEKATAALDRIYFWTGGQPYLSQKLARAISRDEMDGEVAEDVDRLATRQLAGRAALHSEPNMSHIHRQIVNDIKRREALLNLYGRIRKGIEVPADLGSPLHRRLIAVGLIIIDEEGNLAVRNRLYGAVFTARWANENLPTHWRTPAIAAAIVLLIMALPFWYTQLLPRSFVDVLTSTTVELPVAQDAYVNLRSFPGHVDAADNLFHGFLENRARLASSGEEIRAIAELSRSLPDAGRLPEELLAGFWDARVREARRDERRDDALLASIEALVLSTPQRRNRAAMLVADDYPLLIASLSEEGRGSVVFDPDNLLLTETQAAAVTQWSLEQQGLQQRESWSMTALEVSPLVRRVIVDREGTVARIGLTINISHARATDLRIKVIAPSGRAVEVNPNVERASANQDLRVPAAQLRDLVGEPLNGTWSLSVRDEELGVAGRLVGWNLNLNSQGLVEDFQRGLNISDPVERETDNIWLSADGRFAVARAMQSDSARVWDLAFAKPVRAVAVNELEQLIGLSSGARLLVTATQDTVNLWDTTTGRRSATLPIGAASASSMLTEDGAHLFVQRRTDSDTTFELWSLETAAIVAELEVAGTPALVSLDSSGQRIAISDYDRAVRVWDFRSGSLVVQIDLAAQPSEISLAAGGELLATVFGTEGISVWRIDSPARPLLEEFAQGRWQLAFSPSGTRLLAGRPERGFRVYDTARGRVLGPTLGSGAALGRESLLAFSADEQIVVTGGDATIARFWRAPSLPAVNETVDTTIAESIWTPSGDTVAAATPDAMKIVLGDQNGNVHIVAADAGREGLLQRSDELSFFGHNAEVRHVEVSIDGRLVASTADDNTLRVWTIEDGLPRQFIVDVPGAPVEQLSFAPGGDLLGILNDLSIAIFDSGNGDLLARFELPERHEAIAFADPDHLYIGGQSGALRVITRDAGGGWSVQTRWQGDTPIRLLQASPDSRFLVLVDANNLAQQFNLAEGRIGETILQLPGAVSEVTFSPGGVRVLFRTSNWVHQASSLESGLIWLDAILAPKALTNARMVFGDPERDEAAALGNRFFLPVAADGYPRLAELDFTAASGSGLFGNKETLLEEWRRRLALVPAQSPDEQF